ncbi:MAG TPA: RHS repeat-associated core domain-containing protein [Anaerolineales bacterium]
MAITSASGTLISQQRYLPFGQVRTDVGSITQTDFAFTGQRNNSYINLMDYHARMLDPLLSRFIQPDTIIPDQSNPQTWNRYSYVQNDPITLTDPSGNKADKSQQLKAWFYKAYGSHWQQYWRAWDKGRVAPPTCAQLGCKPDARGSNNSTESNSGSSNNGSNNSTTDNYCASDPWDCNGNYGGPDSNVLSLPIDPTQNPQTTPSSNLGSDCPPTEKCDTTEALLGVGLIVVPDLIEIVAMGAGFLAGGPIGSAGVAEVTEPLWIPANVIGAALVFDSGVVKDFNRTAWNCTTWVSCGERLLH